METSKKNLQEQNTQTDIGARNTNKEIIIVSGSSGLIGTGLINKLAEQYRVAGLDDVGFPFPPIKAECV